MKKSLVMLIVLTVTCTIPAMAARTIAVPIEHPMIELYQAYPGNTEGTNLAFRGYDGVGGDLASSAPGILSIAPGTDWANFVGAARVGVRYSLKNVMLTKQTPAIVQCSDWFPTSQIIQQGTANIRLWWPLMYEVPSTTWTLTILYGTYTAWDDDGNGPNPATYVHTEVWKWHLNASVESMKYLLDMFHTLPFGTDEVPIISDDLLYARLQEMLDQVIAELENGQTAIAGEILGQFEMEIADACIGTSPMNPDPSGPGVGIALTSENPACCKLMADAEYVSRALDIWVPDK